MIESILIVDDEEAILETLSEVFRKLGWQVFTAANAEEALIEFKKHSPILVLTDLRLMDSVGGVGICEEVKNIAPLTMVVAMTGYGSEAFTVANLRRTGFDSVLSKPIFLADLEILALITAQWRAAWDVMERLNGPVK